MARDYYREDDETYDDHFEDLEELEIPDVPWKEDIENVNDVNLKLREIHKAEKFRAEKKSLDDKLASGEISPDSYDNILRPKIRKATTRCGLASVGLTYDDLGDVAEDYDLLTTGTLEKTDQKDRLKKTIENIGPDAAQELADRMHDEERLSEDTYDSINRQIRKARTGKRR